MSRKKKGKKGSTPSAEPVLKEELQKQHIPRRNRERLALIIAALAVIGALAIGYSLFRSPSVSAGSFRGFNVLFVTIDTLRADHLPVYGYSNVETPNLDSLAKRSFVFENAIAHAPLTLPSHTSMMTGMLPIGHGVLDNGGFTVTPGTQTLAKILKKQGYKTAAFVSAFVLDSMWKLDQGFDLYFDRFDRSQSEDQGLVELQRKAESTEFEAAHWIEENKNSPFFCWVHFYDPHHPYDPPEPFKTQYSSNLYDGEIAYTDSVLGKLLDVLKQTDLEKNTLIILTADHGEGLGDHEEVSHSIFIYRTTTHVPLLISLPGLRERKIPQTVSHVDLAPTILEWLGFLPDSQMQGTSLIPLLEGKEKNIRTGFSMSSFAELHYGWSPLRSITTNEYKYIDAPSAELYDLKKDPGELKNLFREKVYIAKTLKDRLDTIVREKSQLKQSGPSKIDPEVQEKLQALGYIGNTATSTPESKKVDPKDKVHIMQAIEKSLNLLLKKNYDESFQLSKNVVDQDPTIPEAHFGMGAAYAGKGEYEKALDSFFKALALRPKYPNTFQALGDTYQKMGNLKEAESWYLKVLQYEDRMNTQIKLAHVYREMNQPDRAREYFLKCIHSYEETLSEVHGERNRSDAHSTLGELYFGAGNLSMAEKNYRAAIELTPREPLLHFNLAQIFESRNDVMNAIREYEAEAEISPSDVGTFTNLGLLYRSTGNLSKSNDCFRKVLELQPGSPQGSYLLAENYVAANTNLEEALRLVQNTVMRAPQFQKGHMLLAEIYKKLGRQPESVRTMHPANPGSSIP